MGAHVYVKNFEHVIDRKAVHGVKTVGVTAAELFAGASRLSGRRTMRIFNEGTVDIYYGIGDNTITSGITGTGYPIKAGTDEVLFFDQDTDTPIYCIAASSNANVKVREL